MGKYVWLFGALFACAQGPKGQMAMPVKAAFEQAKSDTLAFTSAIRAIFQDAQGHYWFGSAQQGVARYDGQAFMYFNQADGLADNQLHSIQEDHTGRIWFSTQSGISSFDGRKLQLHKRMENATSGIAIAQSSQSEVPGSWMRQPGDLWFEAGNAPGAYRFDGQAMHYLPFPPQQPRNGSFQDYAVTAMAEGQQNRLWFATYGAVFGFDGQDFTIINDATLGYHGSEQRLHVRSIFEDSKGRLWIGNNGLGVWLKEGDAYTDFSQKFGLVPPSSKRNGDQSAKGSLEHVFAIAEDRQGHIWFGDRDTGIWQFDGTQMLQHHLGDGGTDHFVPSIYTDQKGVLWVGTGEGHVFTFNGKTFERQF